MNRREVDLFGRFFKSPPHLDPSLQGARLAVLETAFITSLGILKQGLGLKACVIPEFLHDCPARYLQAVFSSIPALAAAASVLSVWISFISFLSSVSVTI